MVYQNSQMGQKFCTMLMLLNPQWRRKLSLQGVVFQADVRRSMDRMTLMMKTRSTWMKRMSYLI